MLQILRVWLSPPLAFGRVGSSDTPCQSFSWVSPDVSPDGTAKTQLAAEDTVEVDANGNPTIRKANTFNRIELKDDLGKFYPVCPFFELHGAWVTDDREMEGAITEVILSAAGLSIADVVWRVEVANLKAYHYTLNDGDRVFARVESTADDTQRKYLTGLSPDGSATGSELIPLVPGPEGVVFGQIQAIRPVPELPGLRLRIYAPAGVVYAPTDLDARIALDSSWSGLDIPSNRRIVNPQAIWSNYVLGSSAPGPVINDGRVNPTGLAATIANSGRILGLVDDVSDGLVQCTVGNLPSAVARIVIGPPDFSPGTRPFVSLQDGLADRTERQTTRDANMSMAELEMLVTDIFERALETSDLVNKDAQNMRAHGSNPGTLSPPSQDFEQPPIATLWPRQPAGNNIASRVDALPVSFRGQRAHRRLNALEYIKSRLQSDPAFIDKWLRPPMDELGLYDRRMPALMRGSDRNPMHLSRRQFELVVRWAASFNANELS